MTVDREQTTGKHPPSAGSAGREAISHPLRFFLWLTQTYGDIVQYRSSVEPAYLINHPDYVRHVLQTNGQNYNKDTYLNKHLIESLTGQGLLTSENPLWREQRRLIQPAFHRRSLDAFAGLMNDAQSPAGLSEFTIPKDVARCIFSASNRSKIASSPRSVGHP